MLLDTEADPLARRHTFGTARGFNGFPRAYDAPGGSGFGYNPFSAGAHGPGPRYQYPGWQRPSEGTYRASTGTARGSQPASGGAGGSGAGGKSWWQM